MSPAGLVRHCSKNNPRLDSGQPGFKLVSQINLNMLTDQQLIIFPQSSTLAAARPNKSRMHIYCVFALNLIFEFQTFFTPKNCAKSKNLATPPYTGSLVLYGDVVDFATRRLSHGRKKTPDNKKGLLYEEFTKFGVTQFF